MKWKELWGVEVESSKSVSLRISISEGEDTAQVLGIRKWVQRGTEKYPTKGWLRNTSDARDHRSAY